MLFAMSLPAFRNPPRVEHCNEEKTSSNGVYSSLSGADVVQKQHFEFLKSAFSLQGRTENIKEILQWLKVQNDRVHVKVEQTCFSKLRGWHYDKSRGSLCHESGRFFSIDGIQVETNWGGVNQWDQPIINQPEIGYLGFLVKEFNGVLHFLVQAKIEPGNVNNVQLSPTLQATKSNYLQVHNGKKPDYLDYFTHAKPNQILVDQLQSEQGARFLRKRNRNIIVRIDDDIEIRENFKWLTLAQIKSLIQYDNVVNMDTRTVISGIPFGNYNRDTVEFFNFLNCSASCKENNTFLISALISVGALHSLDEIISFITKYKSHFELQISGKDLNKLDDWVFSDDQIRHAENKFFKVIPVDVEIGSREVKAWSQPLVYPAQKGLCVFVCKEINGKIHFAVQAKVECGNLDILELAPTVQCLTGNYQETAAGRLPFLNYVLNADSNQILHDSYQSEEGGRFYHEQNRNMIILAGDEIPVKLPERYMWMTLNQLSVFLKFNNYLNIQARSLISAITFI